MCPRGWIGRKKLRFLLQNDINNDRGTQYGRDDVQRNESGFAGERADEVTQQGERSSGEQGAGQEGTVVGGAQEQACQMGDGQADEGNGAAEGGAYGRKEAGGAKQERAGAADADA